MDRSIRILFIAGILIAAVAALVSSSVLPWLVGGTGIVTGIIAWRQGRRSLLLASIALVVALSAIREQPFNPVWLTSVVFFVRVFVAHVALSHGFLEALVQQPRDLGLS